MNLKRLLALLACAKRGLCVRPENANSHPPGRPRDSSAHPRFPQPVLGNQRWWRACGQIAAFPPPCPRLAVRWSCASGYPDVVHSPVQLMRLHLHLLSDSTGETLENIAKAALAQYDDVETLRHFWPMVRSEAHLERILQEIALNSETRRTLESRCRAMGLPAIAPLDPVNHALSQLLGQEAKARPGRQHMLDAAYFARVAAIQWTIAHDDGIGSEDWEEADIVLAGVSRSSKTPTSIYLANRGYKTANIPIVVESTPPAVLFNLRHPLIVGLPTSAAQ